MAENSEPDLFIEILVTITYSGFGRILGNGLTSKKILVGL
jgi:hypothetical protein